MSAAIPNMMGRATACALIVAPFILAGDARAQPDDVAAFYRGRTV